MHTIKVSIIVVICIFLSACTAIDSGDLLDNGGESQERIQVNGQQISPKSMLTEKEYEQIDSTLESFEELENIISFSILENDQCVKKIYYQNVGEDYKNNVFSVTKSITSMLVGIAIEEGYILSADQTIDEFLDSNKYELTEEQKSIRIEDILTMTMGLYWNSDNLSLEYHKLKRSDDKIEMILARDMVHDPGTTFNYSDGAAHMMSIIFSKATGKSLHEYAIEKIFIPLEIEDTRWIADENGNSYGGFGLHLSCEDMGKIGILVKNNGKYNDVQVVPSSWIKTSTSFMISTGTTSTHNNQYGYYWWNGHIQGINLYAAIGHGGQFIYILPELNLVITSACYGSVSDDKASHAFSEIRGAIVNEIIPVYINRNK